MTESVETIESPQQSEGSTEQKPENETKWTEGEPLTFVRVRFPGNAKSFPFLVQKKTFSYGQKVVAMSDRGMDVGYINSFPYEVPFKKEMLPIRSISKVATQEDIDQQKENIQKEKEAEKLCIDLIDELKLDMTITHVEIIQFGKKLVFYFTAPARVDFRELVKRLVSQLKMRIELRQISVRDRAAALGSIASCGLPTCCSSFLQSYGHVSVKMAKNQNLALIPSKINGVCGQIKCCIKYENHVYTEKRKKLPPENQLIKAKNGDKGKVTKLHLFIEQFDMLTIDGKIRRYSANQFDGNTDKPSWEFPRRFDNIINETQNVIGLELIDPTPIIPHKNKIIVGASPEEDLDDTRTVLAAVHQQVYEKAEKEKAEKESTERNENSDDQKKQNRQRSNRNRNRNRNNQRRNNNSNKDNRNNSKRNSNKNRSNNKKKND
jgi:cell fate regulator YaaT (PSP1 superfamily)